MNAPVMAGSMKRPLVPLMRLPRLMDAHVRRELESPVIIEINAIELNAIEMNMIDD